jgi:probable HAF family extracellular repeat protein
LAVVAAVAGCCEPALAGMYAITPINVPSFSSIGYGINDSGAIVGFAGSTPGTGQPGAFLYSGGVFSYPSYPNSFGTFAFAINNAGQLAGTYLDSLGNQHAFISTGANYQNIDPPVDPSQLFATATSINNHGQVLVNNLNLDLTNSNFLYANGQFSPLSAIPASGYASGINDAGKIPGTTTDSSNVPHGFLLQNGQLTQIDDPNAGTAPFFNGTRVNGINNNGVVVGFYSDANNNTHGFIDDDGSFTTFDVPGADTWDFSKPFRPNGTRIWGINDQGQIVGDYFFKTDPNNPNSPVIDQAFLATPVPEPSSLTLVTIAGLAVGWRLKRRT